MKAQRIGVWVSVIVLAILAIAASAWVRERHGYAERKLIVDRQTAALELRWLAYLNEVKRIDSCARRGIDLRLSTSSCGSQDSITVLIPETGSSGIIEVKGSEYSGFEVNGKYTNRIRIDLDKSQSSRLRAMIISKLPGVSPLKYGESDDRSTSAAFEACLNGRYYAAYRESGNGDAGFNDFEHSLMGAIGAKRMQDTEKPLLLCL
jgi:hypothetical protein